MGLDFPASQWPMAQPEPAEGATVSGCRSGTSGHVLSNPDRRLAWQDLRQGLAIPLHLPRLSWLP
jgi:hypothetical protein